MSAPLMGVLSILIFVQINPQEVQSEVGVDIPITETLFWLPVTSSIGALAGAIMDARRDFQLPQILTVCLLMVIVVPIIVIFSLFWFVRLVGVRWLYEHGLYFGN